MTIIQFPDTECTECFDSEASRLAKLAKWWDERRNPYRYVFAATRGQASLLSVALGRPIKTWKERHYELWVEFGNPKELERYLKHVE